MILYDRTESFPEDWRGLYGAFDEKITVRDGTTAADIEDWDSLIHITLTAEAENAFDIRISMKDVLGLQTVCGLADIIERSL